MKAYVLGGSILTAALISALVAQQSGYQAKEPTGGKSAMTAGREENMANMTPTQRFITNAYRCNLFTVQLGKLVAEKTNQDNVKQFARMISDDHTKVNEQIRELAQRKNIQLPTGLYDWQQSILQHLSRMPVEDLGRCFVFHQVGEHHVMILENRYEANHASDNDVKTFATKMVPDLQNHLREADRLSQQLIGGAGGVTSER